MSSKPADELKQIDDDDEKAEYILDEWQCKDCTLIQPISNKKCQVCGASNIVSNTSQEQDDVGDCIYYDMIMEIIEQSPNMTDNDFTEFMVKLESIGITSDENKSKAISIYQMIKLQQNDQNSKSNLLNEHKMRSNYNSSKAVEKLALQEANGLKLWMKHNGIWQKDLFLVLVQHRITSMPEHLFMIDNWYVFNELIRKVRVAKKNELKSSEAQKRLDKILTKFEKIWRKQTGFKMTSIKEQSKNKVKGNKKKKKPNVETNNSGKGELKSWMRKNNIWQLALFDELCKLENMSQPETMIKEMDEVTFNAIVRKVRVERFSQLKDNKARLQCDKILVKFEKVWRNRAGIKKTHVKKK